MELSKIDTVLWLSQWLTGAGQPPARIDVQPERNPRPKGLQDARLQRVGWTPLFDILLRPHPH